MSCRKSEVGASQTNREDGLDFNPPDAMLPRAPQRHSVFQGARALDMHDSSGDWHLRGRLSSSPRSWNETGALTGQVGDLRGLLDTAAGENSQLARDRRHWSSAPRRLVDRSRTARGKCKRATSTIMEMLSPVTTKRSARPSSPR